MDPSIKPAQKYSDCPWFNISMPDDTPDILACYDFPNEIQGLYGILSRLKHSGATLAELIDDKPPKTYSERFDQIAYDDLSPRIKTGVDAIDALFLKLREIASLKGEITEAYFEEVIDLAKEYIQGMKSEQQV
jgi:hypothetical protein